MRWLALAAGLLLLTAGDAGACTLPGLAEARLPAPLVLGDEQRPVVAADGPQHAWGYASRAGDAVRAVAAGIVVHAGQRDSLGKVVEIAHGGGASTLYGRLHAIDVREGECIPPGRFIGEAGCTGPCDPHLHFEIRRHGTQVDPAPYMAVAPARVDVAEAWQRVDRGALYEAVVATVEKEFLDQSLLERIGWRQQAAALRPEIEAAPTAGEAIRLLGTLLARLETSHTALYTPDDYQYYVFIDVVGVRRADAVGAGMKQALGSMRLPGFGAFTREVGDRHFIDGVLEGSAAEKAGLLYGDEVLRVDGAAYSPVAALRGKVGKTVSLTIRRHAGEPPRDIAVPVAAVRPGEAFLAATAASARIIEAQGQRIGYIHVWSSHDAGGFRKAFDKLLSEGPWPDRLIVDMRGRVGGRMGVVREMLALLDNPGPRPSYWGRWRTLRQAPWHSGYRSEPQPAAKPGEKARLAWVPSFRGRTVLLVDSHTRSAGEILAHGFKRGGFGTVIGTGTAGAVSSGAVFAMPGGLLLYLAVVGHSFDGVPLEGVGVSPDRRVVRPLEHAAGADPVLEAAVAHVAGMAP